MNHSNLVILLQNLTSPDSISLLPSTISAFTFSSRETACNFLQTFHVTKVITMPTFVHLITVLMHGIVLNHMSLQVTLLPVQIHILMIYVVCVVSTDIVILNRISSLPPSLRRDIVAVAVVCARIITHHFKYYIMHLRHAEATCTRALLTWGISSRHSVCVC